MANTRFKTENGLLVTGGNAEFTNVEAVYIGNTSSRTNLYVEGDLVQINGDLYVTGEQIVTAGLQYTGDLTPASNTTRLGNTTQRWVITGNSLNLSTTLSVTGATTLSNTIAVTGAATLSNTIAVTGAATFSNNLSVTGILTATSNVNFVSGVLFVDSATNRVGINNSAPGVALRVTGATDISTTANVQGNANVGGTLGVNGATTIANTLTLNDTSVFPAGVGTSLISGKRHQTSDGFYNVLSQTKIVNTAMTVARAFIGVKSEIVNESIHRNSDNVTLYNPSIFGSHSHAHNGNNSVVTNARTNILYANYSEAINYANGSIANTVAMGAGGVFAYESFGSGVTTDAHGALIYVKAGNSSITGNITTAYGVRSQVVSNTGMTIGTGYLFHGQHFGSTTTNKYGLFLTDESNNYISGNVHVAGTVNAASYRIGASTLIANATGITHTGFANITGSVNSAILSVGTSFIANTTGAYHTGTINAASHTVGTSTTVNSTALTIGTIGTANGINITTGFSVAGNLAIMIGNSTVNTVITANTNARGRRTIVANSSTPNGPQDVNASPQNGDIVYIY